MAAPCQPCGVGLSQCHLRRIGSRASVSDVAAVIHFWKTVTLIGRNQDVVDYFLSCGTPRGSGYISRIHARVIRTSTYELVDSSLTGVYVNDVRIHGRISLQEGDTVTFGHPAWQSVTLGARARQPNSPFYFLFEQCHCSLDQMQQQPGEVPVLLPAAGASPEIHLGPGSAVKAGLPRRACAAPGLTPARLALSELNSLGGCRHPAAFCPLARPLSSAASAQPPVTPSLSVDSANFSSSLPKMPGDSGPGALPDPSQKGSIRSRSQIRRSLSPEYAVLKEEIPGAPKPSSWGARETKSGSLIQGGTILDCSDPTGGSEELPAGCRPGSHKPFPRESCSSQDGTCPLHATCRDRHHSPLPVSAGPDESVTADPGHSQCGPQVSPAEPPRDVQQFACSFQAEEGDGPGLSPPGPKDLVSSGSGHHQEVMETDESTEGTADSDAAPFSKPGARERVSERMEEAGGGGPVGASAGCSGDGGLEEEEEGTVEGCDDEVLMEEPLPEAGLQETEWAAAESGRGDSLTSKAETFAPESLDLPSGYSGGRTLGDLRYGREPEGVLPASPGPAEEIDPEALSSAVPCETQDGRGAREADSQGSASEGEGQVEMLPRRDPRLLAMGCPLDRRDVGSVDLEVESGLGELSFTKVGIQTGGTGEGEVDPVVAEPREERGASRASAGLQSYGSGMNTHEAEEPLPQQLSKASAPDFPTCEVSSKGEFSREGTIPAAAFSGVMQENPFSEDLLGMFEEEAARVAAAPPAGLVSEKGIVLQELLEEQPMDLDGKHFEECPSQRSEACTEEGQESAAAGRELEGGSTGWTTPDPAAEGQLAACGLGHEEERCPGDGVAQIPVCASLSEPPGGREPDSLCGRESEGQEEVDHDGASGGGESKAQRGGRSIASAFPAGAAVGESRPDDQPGRLSSWGSAGEALARSLEGGVTWHSAAGSWGHTRPLPPFQLSDNIHKEGGGGGLPPSDDFCAGAQSRSLFERSEDDSGGRRESETSCLLPKQDDTKDEREANLSNEIQARAQSGSGDATPMEDAPHHREAAEPEQEDDSPGERWTGCRESRGMPSGPSAQSGCQADSPLPQEDGQETGLRAGEPQGLGGNPEVEPQGAGGGKGPHPVEGCAWEEAGQPDVAVECPALSSLEGCGEEAEVPEQGRGREQSPRGSSCGGEKGQASPGLCAARLERSQPPPGSTARPLPRQSQTDSGVDPESPGSDECVLRISGSEAEREDGDNSQAHGTGGREATILKERRDALISDPGEHQDLVPENSEVGGKLTERRAEQDHSEAANPETGDGPPKATAASAQQNPPSYEPCCEHRSAASAAPETSLTGGAVGGKCTALVGASAAREELEGQVAEGTAPVPLNLPCVSEEDPCLSARDAELGIEGQALGEIGPDLLEDSGRLESRFAGQPGGEVLELGATPEEHLQSGVPACVSAEEVEHAQKAEEKAPLGLSQGRGTQQPREDRSPAGDHPGCSKWLESPEYDRSPFPKEEEPKGCSSRKRHCSEEDQALGMVDWGPDSCGPKRLRPLDSGSDLPSSARTLSAPLDLERRFNRTIGKFLQQYNSQITLPSDETEEKTGDSIAQIVRTYFRGAFGPEEPEAENPEVERSALPLEARMCEDVDCESAAPSEAERSAAGEETESPLAFHAEPRVDPVERQDPCLPSDCSSPSAPSPSSGPHSQQPGQELAHHVPESAWEAYFSEEEEFQSSISSVLEPSLLNSPAASPKALRGQEPRGKNVDVVGSDTSSRSAESADCEPPPKLVCRSSVGTGSGEPHGTLSEAAEVDLAPGGACRSPEPADVAWCKEESSAPSGMCMSSRGSIQFPERDLQAEPEDHFDALGENTAAPILRQADGTFDGEGGHDAPNTEASEQATPCVSPPVGEAREELDDGTSKRQIEDGASLQGSHEDAPFQELECKPAIHQPPDASLGGRRAPPVKVEPAPRHARELFDEHGNAAAVTVTSEPVGCPMAGDSGGEVSISQSSSLSRASPSPGQTRVCRQDRIPCLLSSVKQDGGAETAGAEACRKLQSREDGSSLGPLPPRGPAGIADDPEEKDFGEGLESDLGRSGARWAGQTGTRSAARGDAGEVGGSSAPSLTVAGCGNQTPACSPLVQEDAAVSIQLPSLPSVPPIVKEEADPCSPHVPVAGLSPCGAYPTASSPVIPVLEKSRIAADASENWVPESPVGCNEEGWLLDEAEAPGPSGNERAPYAEAKGGRSSASTASDPPPQGDPWSYEDGSVWNTSTSNAGGAESSPRKCWASSEQEVAFQLQECQSVLEEILQSLGTVEGIDDLHLEKWRDQVAELQKATKMPKTYIAVVGNTGAGKSSLLNALLDEEAVLPTSAMRACTAVVVEVSGAAGGSRYEAEVEFLSRERNVTERSQRLSVPLKMPAADAGETSGTKTSRPRPDSPKNQQLEWHKELTALLKDMKGKSGNLKKRYPDRKTEAGAAYSRVKAVYGRVDEIAKLESLQDVTQHLGTVKRISAETAADFRVNIEKFIDSRTDNLRDMKGGEFWPIVKCVKIRVAQAEVLKTGVVLVDLPGIRDSNAARDNAAKEYLKNCNAVWVVASITRAVDDKTAKEILNSNLRRQLFMDGQYGNLAFICTKTDSFNISDIVRDLDLRKEIQPLEEELEELERQRMQAEEEKGTLHMSLQLEQQRRGVEDADPAWLQRQHRFLEQEFRLSALQKQKEAKLRAIGLVCVQARNQFSKQRIRMDFNTGLEELKRRAEFSEREEDGDEDLEDGDFAGSDPGDPGEAESQREKLHVFAVSSTEYLKLRRKLLRDGSPQVFHDPEDTEIPALKNFAIETGLKTSMKATEKVIRDVARVVSQIVHYLTNQRAEDISHQTQVQEIVQRALQDVPRVLQEAAEDVLHDIRYLFGILIQTSLSRGSDKAKEQCEDIVKSWGLPDCGVPHSTYHAVCLRRGVYTSPKCGCVDFNSHLAKPVYDAIAGAWSEVFGSKLEESLQRFTKAVLDKLKFFFQELKRNVGRQSSLTEALHALHLQQMEATQARLRNFLLDQEACISRKQRAVSRMLTPAIQAGMEPAYEECGRMSGPGYFQKMKDLMENYIHNHKNPVFDAATRKLQEQLDQLQQDICGSFEGLLSELNKSLRMQFEPLLKPVQKNAEIIPGEEEALDGIFCRRPALAEEPSCKGTIARGAENLMNICAKVDKICKRSCVEYVLPSAPQAEACSPETERELQENPQCFSALYMDIRLGATPLPHVAAIQVSGQDLTLTLTDESEVALPLGSVALCESCLPLGCLILHVSSESAGEICRRCRVQAPSPGQQGREALVILDKDQDQTLFSRLVASVSSSCRDAFPVQRLSLFQGRERLESLGVYHTPRQPQPPLVNLVPYGKKRAGEASPAPLEKRHKSQAGPDHVGRPLPSYSWCTEGKMASFGQRAASCPLPMSGVCFPEDCKRKASWLPGAARHSMPAKEPIARPSSAGAPVPPEEGFWGKCCDPDSKRGRDQPLKTWPVESGKEASPAGSSWPIR